MHFKISLLGSKGTVVIGGFAVNKVETWNIIGDTNSKDYLNENPRDVYGFGHVKFYKHLVDVIKNNIKSKILVDGLEGEKSIKITALDPFQKVASQTTHSLLSHLRLMSF